MTGVRLPEQNLVIITGRLTRDPEIFRTPHGIAKCRFRIASDHRYRDKATGEWKELVTYVPVVVWREVAERCKERLVKGSPVHIEGRLSSWESEDEKSGQKRTVLELEARRVQFLSAAKAAEPGSPGGAAEAQGQGGSGEHSGSVADEMEEVPS